VLPVTPSDNLSGKNKVYFNKHDQFIDFFSIFAQESFRVTSPVKNQVVRQKNPYPQKNSPFFRTGIYRPGIFN
jgi:hypothetical protein